MLQENVSHAKSWTFQRRSSCGSQSVATPQHNFPVQVVEAYEKNEKVLVAKLMDSEMRASELKGRVAVMTEMQALTQSYNQVLRRSS